MTDAWDGRPEQPERDGAHVLRDKRTGKVRTMQWEGSGGEWWGFSPRRAAHDYDYLGPALLPADIAALQAQAREAALREAAEVARVTTSAPGQRNAKDQWRESIGNECAAAILALIPQQ